ncbi:cyclase [Mycolicibacterium agri]|uniref:Cyclase n=1 Tax=Mycolicibacterium agri TaxID=36811 RepID=A0A2A7N315_MYCAG|nr:cyclase [Mycolicibacterium agri]
MRATARFCDTCGARLERVEQHAEYKHVTVLFADVVRSMDIAATLGAEGLREIMTELVECCGAVVRRYGGAVTQFTGDGFMALFGAPIAMEDHAVRACLAALDVQAEAQRLAAEFDARYGVALKLRVGLNSGAVVAGDIGSGPMGYTASGRHVGMAQRMESVAPPGGVMLSESTARLVELSTELGEPEAVRIKGSAEPVVARQLLAVKSGHALSDRRLSPLVGRASEMRALADLMEKAISGQGAVVGVVGPPGIGKSRLAGEASRMAKNRGIDVFQTYCESHSRDVPFHAAAGLLRQFFAVGNLSPEAARTKIRATLPASNEDDLVLLDDLLRIGDAGSAVPIDPDARRRRLASLLNAASQARDAPALFVIEDAHWMDAVSESMLAEFISVAVQTPSLVLITYRPEYRGALRADSGATTISLSPLDATDASTLVTELLGSDPSVADVAPHVAERSAGNPFFTEEIIRDLVERGVVEGERGAYVRRAEGDVAVPATVHATIAARIDRLDAAAKRTLCGAAVIGSRFSADLLAAVLDDVALKPLLDAELLQKVTESQARDYAFRHPLLRAVAYESQLKSDRATLHRKIATALEEGDPESAEANAALIATHLESAGELAAAFEWYMRAGAWSTHRDITAARINWQRARTVADRLPEDHPARTSMRIAPRTLLCATFWRVGGELADIGFDELRELATATGDKRSLAFGMTGLIQMLNFYGKYAEAAEMADEFVALLESIDDAEVTVGLMPIPIVAKWDVGEMAEARRLARRTIELADGDPTMGNLVIGSPLAFALALHASASCISGIDGWERDYDRAVELARAADTFTFCAAVMFKYIAIENWALLADDTALNDTAEALEIARQFGDDFSLTTCEFVRGTVLVRRDDVDRQLGFELLEKCRRVADNHRFTIITSWCADLELAAEKVRTGDYDAAIELCRGVLAEETRSGEMMNRGWSTTVLVDALLRRGLPGDVVLAQAAVDELAATPTEPVYLYHELPLLRLNAMLASARSDHERYRHFRDRYRARAEETGMLGHIAIANAMD